MYKIKLFFSTLMRFIKLNHIYAVVLSLLLGTFAAVAVTVFIVKSFNSKQISDGDFSSSVYSSFAEPVIVPVVEEVILPAEPQPVEKQVEYKGQSINVVKVEVAKPDSKEDVQNGSYKAEKTEQQTTTTEKVIKYKPAKDGFVSGIDVSSHNKEIDWEKVKNAGVQFVVIRCGYRGYLTGKIVLDSAFDYNIENAYKNGIDIGIYFYSTATNETEALEEAAYVAEVLKAKEEKGIKITYPVAYDFEEFYNNDDRTRARGLTAATISKNTDAFLSFIKLAGYKSMLYAGKNPVKQYWEPWVVSKYDFWLANYANATEYTGNFLLWQYTSSGTVAGIEGRVDLNVCGFPDNNNLPRYVVCVKDGTTSYKKPQEGAEAYLTLKEKTVYLCRYTYNPDYCELKIDGKYCYVNTEGITEISFAEPENQDATYKGQTLYLKPIDEKEYKAAEVTPDENAQIKLLGIWENIWAKIKYNEKEYYIKADGLFSDSSHDADTDSNETTDTVSFS